MGLHSRQRDEWTNLSEEARMSAFHGQFDELRSFVDRNLIWLGCSSFSLAGVQICLMCLVLAIRTHIISEQDHAYQTLERSSQYQRRLQNRQRMVRLLEHSASKCMRKQCVCSPSTLPAHTTFFAVSCLSSLQARLGVQMSERRRLRKQRNRTSTSGTSAPLFAGVGSGRIAGTVSGSVVGVPSSSSLPITSHASLTDNSSANGLEVSYGDVLLGSADPMDDAHAAALEERYADMLSEEVEEEMERAEQQREAEEGRAGE
jgi:hypothetical protein